MLDPAYLRENIEIVRAAMRNRGVQADAELEQLATLEARRRRLIPELEGLKREQNAAGDEVARAKRQGLDATPVFAANKARAQQIRQLEIQTDQVEQQRAALLMIAAECSARERAGWVERRTESSKFAATASRGRSISRRARIGKSVRRSASSISSAPRRCPARDSRC